MLPRKQALSALRAALKRAPCVALIGPRQCGKTTLARRLVKPDTPAYFDLESPLDLARLENPLLTLGQLKGTVVIDEVQRRPDLFPVLRVLADRAPRPARFLILGSASPELLRQSTESLAGRIETIELSAFRLAEVGAPALPKLWLRGGFPRAFLARGDTASLVWREQFVRTFLERDVPQFGIRVPAPTLRRFWTMVAHYHGQIWNSANPARSLGISETTVRTYLDLLTGLLMIRQLPAWHENLLKRQVRAPKVYFRDTGLLHTLLGIRTDRDLQGHPKSGASWEGLAVEEVLHAVGPDEAYFWATHQGAELDLLLFKDGRRIGVECKQSDGPRVTRSMRIAMEDLALERLLVVYPGGLRYDLDDRIAVLPLPDVARLGLRTIDPAE